MATTSYPASGADDTGAQSGVVNHGTISGPVAGGVNSHFTQQVTMGSPADTMAQLELALQQLTTAAASELDRAHAERVNDDAARIAEEARHQRPDRERITQLLGRITAQVGSAAALLAAVARVRDLIEALLH